MDEHVFAVSIIPGLAVHSRFRWDGWQGRFECSCPHTSVDVPWDIPGPGRHVIETDRLVGAGQGTGIG